MQIDIARVRRYFYNIVVRNTGSKTATVVGRIFDGKDASRHQCWIDRRGSHRTLKPGQTATFELAISHGGRLPKLITVDWADASGRLHDLHCRPESKYPLATTL